MYENGKQLSTEYALDNYPRMAWHIVYYTISLELSQLSITDSTPIAAFGATTILLLLLAADANIFHRADDAAAMYTTECWKLFINTGMYIATSRLQDIHDTSQARIVSHNNSHVLLLMDIYQQSTIIAVDRQEPHKK